MRSVTRWLLVLLAGLALCAPLVAAKAKRPKVAVVVASVSIGGEGRRKDDADVSVMAGYVKGKGWLNSEKAGPLMRKGDRMGLYTLDPLAQRVGQVEMTNNGQDLGADEEASEWGWVVEARVIQPLRDKTVVGVWRTFEERVGQSAEGKAVVGIWRAPTAPEPKWVTGKRLSPDNVVYRAEVLAWLKKRGVSEPARRQVEVREIIKADLNGDKRDEVLISFHSPQADQFNNPEMPKPRYSYLVMRSLPRGSPTPRTTIVNDDCASVHYVDGLCDLDGDGWAEIISHDGAQDYGTDWIHYWNGKGFRSVSGCGGGA